MAALTAVATAATDPAGITTSETLFNKLTGLPRILQEPLGPCQEKSRFLEA